MTGAKEYALALFSLSEELGRTEAVLSDVKDARAALSSEVGYFKLADTPSIPIEEKLSLIKEAFGKLDECVLNLMCILCERHSVRLFPDIAKEYAALYNEARGISEAEAISAVPLTKEQLDAIGKKLQRMTGKTIIMKNTVDRSVLGGIKLRYMGKQLDSSLRSRLDSIENSLKNTII